jgi:hypothetical protein
LNEAGELTALEADVLIALEADVLNSLGGTFNASLPRRPSVG